MSTVARCLDPAASFFFWPRGYIIMIGSRNLLTDPSS